MQITIRDNLPRDIVDFASSMPGLLMRTCNNVRKQLAVLGLSVIKPYATNNVRDSFAHFKRLSEKVQKYTDSKEDSSDILYVIAEFELMVEHCTRAIIDVNVEALQYLAQMMDGLHRYLMTRNNRGHDVRTLDGEICYYLHRCKSYLIDLRLGKDDFPNRLAVCDSLSVACVEDFLSLICEISAFFVEINKFMLSHFHDEHFKSFLRLLVYRYNELNSSDNRS